MNTRNKFLLLALVAVAAGQASAQTQTHDHAPVAPEVPQVAPTPVAPVMKGMKRMPMDHRAMGHAAAASAAIEAPAMDHSAERMQGGTAPADARDPHAYSGGHTLEQGPYARPGPRELRLADEHTFGSVVFNRLERSVAKGSAATVYDGQLSFGKDDDRLVIKAEGAVAQGKLHDARTELLWGHAISPYWNSQLGLRHDSGAGPDRNWLAVGVQGLAPYWFEVDATAYVGNGGRTALRLGAEYEVLLTQKWVLQPRAELSYFGQDDAANGVGRGLSSGVVGLRLRYEFSKQVAPYIGVERSQKWGRTADLARTANDLAGETRWVAGVRFWF